MMNFKGELAHYPNWVVGDFQRVLSGEIRVTIMLAGTTVLRLEFLHEQLVLINQTLLFRVGCQLN